MSAYCYIIYINSIQNVHIHVRRISDNRRALACLLKVTACPRLLAQEHGEKTCMLEASPAAAGDCDTCQQLCGVTPVKVAGCSATPLADAPGSRDSVQLCKEAKCGGCCCCACACVVSLRLCCVAASILLTYW